MRETIAGFIAGYTSALVDYANYVDTKSANRKAIEIAKRKFKSDESVAIIKLIEKEYEEIFPCRKK